MTTQAISEAQLHALADGVLPEEQRAAIDAHLRAHPDDAARVGAWREQNRQLRALFDPVLDEAVPPALLQATSPPAANGAWQRPAMQAAAAVVLVLAGGMGGWLLRGDAGDSMTASASPMSLARSAAIAHAVYTPEVRHPVEVGAEQEAHLVQWLSKRLGTKLQPPALSPLGYHLIGGRLLPGDGDGPVAQFMYEDGGGKRLTLYAAKERAGRQETAFRYTQEQDLSVFYWIDGQLGYALSANLPKQELGKIASAVYAQLEQPR
ncbi:MULTISPECIES: anti-sigma factor [unclassified Janthinobacterium]|uniref:anti-sigma factor family protein n=1 Tax=unclassified Janthinobacterium TaxID=2610881 RepID=UPI001E41A862|nr:MULTISPECIES: anti-sigma factor [unclassified Janthinobacterium]MCC7643618.1 anti-sigma factor [Janthinobacterium sp. EB271-G4-3-1]MCC7691414.1 anti-sigma factor [Janthinobacterium sp. EB271-G4-3-2]